MLEFSFFFFKSSLYPEIASLLWAEDCGSIPAHLLYLRSKFSLISALMQDNFVIQIHFVIQEYLNPLRNLKMFLK